MRRQARPSLKNTRSPGSSCRGSTSLPLLELLPHIARHLQAVLPVDVLDEAAAVEARSGRCRRFDTARRATRGPWTRSNTRRWGAPAPLAAGWPGWRRRGVSCRRGSERVGGPPTVHPQAAGATARTVASQVQPLRRIALRGRARQVAEVGPQSDFTHGADAPAERHLRAAQGRPLAEGRDALVPGQGRDRCRSTTAKCARCRSRFELPSVIRLLRRIRIRRRFDYVPFSRANIYARDHYTCQYCGARFPTADLTFDHVVPVAQGGRKDWENIVTCCITCNRRKGGARPSRPACASSAPAPARQGAGAAHHHRPARHARELARLPVLERRARRRRLRSCQSGSPHRR